MPPKKNAPFPATPPSIITTRSQKRKLSIIDNTVTNNNNEITNNTTSEIQSPKSPKGKEPAIPKITKTNTNPQISNNNNNNNEDASNIASSSKTKPNKKSKTQILDNDSTEDDNPTPPEVQPQSPKEKEPKTSTKTKAKTKRQTMADKKKAEQAQLAKSYKTRAQLAIFQKTTYTAAMLDKRGQIQRKEYFSKVVLTPRDPEKHDQLVTITEGSRVRQFGATDEDSKKWWKVILIFTNKSSPSSFPFFQCELDEEPYTEAIFSVESVLEVQPPSPTFNKEVSNVAFNKAKANNEQPVHHKAPITHPRVPAPPTPSSHTHSLPTTTINNPILQQILQQGEKQIETLHTVVETLEDVVKEVRRLREDLHKDVVNAYQDATTKLYSLAQNK